MRIKLLLTTVLLISVLGTFGQDHYIDSLKQSIRGHESDSNGSRAYLELAKYYYYNLTLVEPAISAVEEAQLAATKSGAVNDVAEAIYWKALFVFGASPNVTRSSVAFKNRKLDGDEIVATGLAYARKYNLKAAESNLLALRSRMFDRERDSAFIFLEKARSIAVANSLPQQEARALAYLGMLYISSNPDTARKCISAARNLLRQTGDQTTEILLLRQIARAWARSQQLDTATNYAKLALQIARNSGIVNMELLMLPDFIRSQSPYFAKDSLEKNYLRLRQLCRQYGRDSLVMMGIYVQTAQDIGHYVAALQTGLQFLHAAEARKDSFNIQTALYQMGLSYEYSQDYARGKYYFKQALPVGKWNQFIYIFTLDDLARCYGQLQQYDSAKYYAAACYQAAKDFYGGESFIFGGVLNDLGSIYFDMGEDSLALNYLRRSYTDFTTNNVANKNFAVTTVALAKYFAKHGPADSVLFYGRLALKTSQDAGFLDNLTEASTLLSQYFARRKEMDSAYHYQDIGFDAYKKLYSYESSREFQNLANAEQQREEELAMARKAAADKYANDLKLYGLLAALLLAIIVGVITFRNNKQRQKSYELLQRQKQEIDVQKSKVEASLEELKTTQQQLIQSEKMASLGELTAGIAHEIQNPLNFVNNFSEINSELLEELAVAAGKGDLDEVRSISGDIKENSEKINHHGKRADAIVKGMLQHSRNSSGQKELTNINALCDEFLRLAYHGLRAKDKSFNAKFETHFDPAVPPIYVVQQEIGRVILNLLNNAFYAVNEKKKKGTPDYEPEVTISTQFKPGQVIITVKDNGAGIPENIKEKIFQPFFTTKPTGSGTGLGLSLSYDIIRAHEGKLSVNSANGDGTAFVIQLPA